LNVLVILFVALGGLIGAPTRFVVDRFVADHTGAEFPFGTMAINVSGSFLLGLLTGLSLASHLPALVDDLVGTGFCGAYTTFSTWSFETVRLLEERELLEAALNALVSLVVGLLAAGAGIALGLLR